MAERVKKRAYDSPRRREQAAATRAAILDAALELFEQQGYAATSVAAIAKKAGVALKTVYAAFGTKRGVLVALRSRLVRGGDDAVPVDRQEWFRAVLEEPDPRKRLAAFAAAAATLKSRAGRLFEIIRQRYAARLTAEQLDELRKIVDGQMKAARALRAVRLTNADEPFQRFEPLTLPSPEGGKGGGLA